MGISKRIIALLLTVALAVGLVPVYAFAQETDNHTTVDNSEMTVEGTNGFGTLLSSEIQAQQAETAQDDADFSGSYNVIGLTVENGTATVEYSSLEEATLVVALYSEDGLQMLTSATAVVSAEETVAEVTFEGSLPQYFLASAYLLDMYDYSPLCAAYETPMYTREMQELLASTVADYDADRVLNLDSSGQTNFAVYAEDTLLIEETEGVNTVASIDEETDTYIFENADETITSLQVGDVFSYAYGEEDILIVKVASIAVDGTTVTITGGEVEMEEVFSHVKIETVNDTQDVTVYETLMDEGVTYDGQYGNTYSQGRALSWDGEESMKTGMGFSISKKVPTNQGSGIGGVEAEVTVSGSVKFNLELTLSYYVSAKRQFLQYTVNTGVTTGIKVTGEVMINMLRLGTWEVSPVLGLYIRMKPYVQLRFTGEMTFDVSYHSTTGFKVEHTKNGFTYKDLSTTPKLDAAFSFEGVVFFGVDLHPEIVIIDDNVAEADLEALIGLEIKSSRTIATTEEPDPNAQEIHNCNRCYDGDVSLVLKVEIKVQFLKLEKLKLVATLAERTSKIGDYYYSADHREFGWKDCPYRTYLVAVTLDHADPAAAAGTAVSAYMLEEKTETPLGETDKNGVVTGYLKAGNYVLQARIQDTDYRAAKNVTGPCKVVLGISGTGSSSGSGSGGAFIQGSIDTDDYQSFDFGTPVQSGEIGDKGENVVWVLYNTGHVLITGNGKIRDMEPHESPFIMMCHNGYPNLHVHIDNGVTGIGDYVFADFQGYIYLYLSEDVTDISSTAFLNCRVFLEDLDPDNPVYTTDEYNFALYKNKKTLAFATYYYVGSDYYSIPSGVTEIGEYAFYNAKSLALNIPDTVTKIAPNAFFGADITVSVDAQNPVFRSDMDAVLIRNGTELFWASRGLSGSYTIPSGIKVIGESAFEGCEDLTDVIIPQGVTTIKDSAFKNCYALGRGKGKVTIPNSVTSIGNAAFRSCELGIVDIPDSVTHIGDYAFANNYDLQHITIGSGVKSMGEYAFSDNENLLTVQIAQGVTQIGYGMLAGCGDLDEIVIPDSVTAIGEYAFIHSNITWFNIPDSVTTIGDYAFYGCSFLSSITIPQGVTYVGDNAFHYCIRLQKLTIPDSVTYLGASACSGNTRLNQVRIGSGLTVIHENTFYDCDHLQDVYYSGTQSQWEDLYIQSGNSSLLSATLHCNDATLAMEGSTALAVGSNEDLVKKTAAETEAPITNEAPVFYAVWDGAYGKEENSSVKTASFTGLVPGGNYVLLSLVSMEAEDLLRMDNLLYITQGVAGEDGSLFFRYVDRTSETTTYVVACGPSHRNLKDAVITFPQMYELDGEQVVDPTVIYDGKTLTEGKDYVLLGTVYVTGAGSYQCTIRGINDYTGSVVCTYTVEAHGHVFEGHVSNGDATCTSDGTKTGKCIHCEETETITDAGSKLPHNWDEGVVTTQPTDKQQGIRTFTCTACSATRTETIPAIGHTHSYSAAVTAPTCTEKGYTTHTCSCGESYQDTYVDATGHTYGSWVVTRAATGAECGIETRTCGCGAEETREIPALTNPFEDVAREKFYYEPVLWAYHGEITTGKDATHFNPSGFCTRSQVVTFLWRAAEKPEPASSENPFPDVPEGKFYTKAVLWAVEQGITAGYKDGTFGPNDACTRGQIVTFLWRYFQQPEPTSLNNPFPDVADSKFYYKAVLWAVEQGVTGGFKDGTFGPNKSCTRDQIVTFLYRAMVQ